MEHIEQTFQSVNDWATHTGQGIQEDNTDNFCAAVEKKSQYYFDLLDIFYDHASAQPWVSLDQMKTCKAMHSSPRRAACRMNYLDSDSSEDDKDNENDEHGHDREEAVEALASARSMIGDLKRDTSMNKDGDDQDETIQ